MTVRAAWGRRKRHWRRLNRRERRWTHSSTIVSGGRVVVVRLWRFDGLIWRFNGFAQVQS